MADAGDLKSPGGNPVRVQVPPPALFFVFYREMLLKRTTKNVLIVLTIGAASGTLIGAILKAIVPDSQVKAILFKDVSFGINQINLNLVFLKLGFSFQIIFNIFTVFFIFLMVYLLIKH